MRTGSTMESGMGCGMGYRKKTGRWRAAPLGLTLPLSLAGCGRAPSFNILGSFFPAWLLCMVVGIVLAALVNWLVGRYKLERYLAWPGLVYPCLAAFFSFTLWLLLFS